MCVKSCPTFFYGLSGICGGFILHVGDFVEILHKFGEAGIISLHSIARVHIYVDGKSNRL